MKLTGLYTENGPKFAMLDEDFEKTVQRIITF